VAESRHATSTALDALLADPARAAEVPAKDRQAVLDTLAVHEGRCRLVRELLTATVVGKATTEHNNTGLQPPYSLKEAAALMLKGPAWLRRKAHAGAIPGAKKIGRSWVFPRADFDRFCQRRQIG
jgi:Helix-turn-helix domain